MKKNTAVRFQQVGKRYQLRHIKPALIDTFLNQQRGSFWALKDISLEIKRGEKIGLIGKNGSGKTTFLKILSGITQQTQGIVETKGKIISLIELDAGFHLDLTGRENIYLNGLLVGMSRREITQKMNQIIRFAGLGKFIDSPLYTYSAGMSLRLGFSVAVHADPDILVLDEGISVGDEGFRRKAQQRIEEFFRQDKTVIIASHWIGFLQEVITKVIWLEKGRVKKTGGKRLLSEYKKTFR